MGASSYLSFIMFTYRLTLACVLLALTGADFVGHSHGGRHHSSHGQLARTGRQEEPVQGGIDFSGCQEDPETGLCCVEKEETVTSLRRSPSWSAPTRTWSSATTPTSPSSPPARRRCARKTLKSSALSHSSSRLTMRQ